MDGLAERTVIAGDGLCAALLSARLSRLGVPHTTVGRASPPPRGLRCASAGVRWSETALRRGFSFARREAARWRAACGLLRAALMLCGGVPWVVRPLWQVGAEDRLPALIDEAVTAAALGFPATFCTAGELPLRAAGAVRTDGQLMLDPALLARALFGCSPAPRVLFDGGGRAEELCERAELLIRTDGEETSGESAKLPALTELALTGCRGLFASGTAGADGKLSYALFDDGERERLAVRGIPNGAAGAARTLAAALLPEARAGSVRTLPPETGCGAAFTADGGVFPPPAEERYDGRRRLLLVRGGASPAAEAMAAEEVFARIDGRR